MARLHLPPLQRLRAFEAAVRFRSFSRAAEEMALTQGAVSQHVRALEAQLGKSLFIRRRTGVFPTEEAQALAIQLRQGLRILERALAGDAQPRRGSGSAAAKRERLAVSVLPSIAARWLTPRLDRFRAQHPEIDLDIRPSIALEALDKRDRLDVALRFGVGGWPGLACEKLMEEWLLPVVSRKYRGGSVPRRIEDLKGCILLRHTNQPWEPFFQAAGLDLAAPSEGPIYADAGLVVDAAIAGQGVALARWSLAEADLKAGRLQRVGDLIIPDVHSYFVVWRPENPKQAAIAAFRHWLQEEAARLPRPERSLSPPRRRRASVPAKRKAAPR